MAKIKLLDFQVLSINLDATSYDKKATKDLKADNFNVNCLSSKSPDFHFGIRYEMSLSNKINDFCLKVEAIAHFECDILIDNEFLNGDFVRVNAPAIGFPYLRAFISNFTLSAGFNPIFLPTYNFVAMAQAKKKKELSEEKKPLSLPRKTKKI